MKTVFAGILALGVLWTSTAESWAFGFDDSITRLNPRQVVHIKSPGREDLCCLGFRTTKVFIGLGVWLLDQGYVLIPVGDSTKYFKLDSKLIQELQIQRLLPNPLPPYKIPLLDYLIGFSLWIVALAGVLCALAHFLYQKLKAYWIYRKQLSKRLEPMQDRFKDI